MANKTAGRLPSYFINLIIMKALHIFFLVFLTFVLFSSGKEKDRMVEVNSPDRAIKVLVQIKGGVPFYSIKRKNQPVILSSKLGFVFKDQPALLNDFKIASSRQTSFDETWSQPWGE